MNTVIPSGITPPYPLPEATPLATVAPTDVKPSAPAAPQIELATLDLVKQSAGATGKANPIDLVDHPQTALIRDLLARKDFDAIAQIVNNFGPRINKLELSLDEIKAIYSGFCDGMLNMYSADEKKAIEKLLSLSQMDINQKVQGLTEMVDFAAVQSLISSSSDQALKGLNATTRTQIIDSLGLNSVMRASTEATRGSGANYQLTLEEQLGAKLLKSVSNDTERLGILEKMSQFSRDDVTFGYINSLSANELAAMPESTKKQLLKHLIDTSICLPLVCIDLNKVFNLDEAMGMVSKNHAEAARRLYVAMKPETQTEQEVQDLRAKSDEFMKQINELEQSLKSDIQTGKIDQKKIDSYRSQLLGLQEKYPNQPELQKKVAELLDNLKGLQDGLAQASQLEHQGVSSLSQTLEQLEQTKTSLNDSQAQLNRLSQTLTESSKELNTAESKLATQIQQLAAMRNQLVGLGDNFTGLLDQLSALPESQLRTKLPQIELLLKQLQQNQSKLEGMGTEQNQIQQQVAKISDSLTKGQQELASSLAKVNQDHQKLNDHKTLTQSLLNRYQEKLNQLESKYSVASEQLQNLSSLPEVERQGFQSDLAQVRQKLDQHTKTAQDIKKGLNQINAEIAGIATQSTQLTAQAADTQTQFTNVETQIVKLEALQETATETREEINQALQAVKAQAMELVNRLKSGPGSIQQMDANKKLKVAQADLVKMLDRLKKEGAQSPDQVAAELKEVESLMEQIKLIQNDSKDVLQALRNFNDELSAGRKELSEAEGKLKESNDAVTAARAQTEKAQTQVNNVQQALAKHQQEIDQYYLQVAALESELNSLSQQNDASKNSYFDVFSSPFEAGATSFDQLIAEKQSNMLSTLSQTDQKRNQIKNDLKALKSTIESIQTTMQTQKQELVKYKSDLSAKKDKLSELTSRVDEIKEKYQQKITDFNTKQLQFQDTLNSLDQKQPQSKLVKNSLERAQKQLSEVQVVQSTASKLLESYSTFAIEAIATQKSLSTGIANLESAISSTDQVLTKIAPVLQQVNQKSEELNQHDQKQSQIEQEIKNINDKFLRREISYEEARKLTRSLNVDSVQAAETQVRFDNLILETEKVIKQATSKIDSTSSLQQRFDNKSEELDQRIRAAQDKISESQEKYDHYQSQFNSSRDSFLKIQKQLLDARRQIGIKNGDYQQILEKMNAILTSGKALSPEDMQVLVDFEQQLQAIEKLEVEHKTQASQHIQALNSLKQNVNQSISDLQAVKTSLESTYQELMQFKQEFSTLKAELEAELPGLKEQRKTVAEAIAMLEAQGDRLSPTDRADLEKLREQLSRLDQTIAASENKIQSLTTTIQRIDEMVGTIETALTELNTLQLKLQLLVVQISHAIQEYELLIDALNALSELVLDLKSKIQSVQQQATSLEKDIPSTTETNQVASQPGPGPATQTDKSSDLTQKRDDVSRQTFTNRLTSQFSNMLSQRQRQSDKQREEKHQIARDALQKTLEQQLQSLRQQESDLNLQIKEQTSLEAATEYLIQQAHLGNSVSSGLNIV